VLQTVGAPARAVTCKRPVAIVVEERGGAEAGDEEIERASLS